MIDVHISYSMGQNCVTNLDPFSRIVKKLMVIEQYVFFCIKLPILPYLQYSLRELWK